MTQNGISYIILEKRGLITVGGEDRRPFLQGLISNDIEKVSEERAIWSALLTPQGKYLHDFFIIERDGIFLIDCEAERLMDLGQRLSRYKLRAKIDLGMADGMCVAALFGNGSEHVAGLAQEAGCAGVFANGIAYVDPRSAALGLRVVIEKETAEEVLRDAGASPGDLVDYEARRFALGVPDGSRDLVVEKSILLESNFDELNGVDWQKGCYIGQELTARTKYRGLIKKRLVPVTVSGDVPPPGAVITLDADGKEAGEMRSSSGDTGLALLRLECLEQALSGEATLRVGGATVTPRKPDWAAF